jgi:hypothetical protein
MNIARFTFCILLAMFLCGFGCSSSKPAPDPLAGFHAASKGLDQSIVNDYQNYIKNLSPEEKQNLGPYPTSFFEDGTGQHAVKIKIGLNGTSWEHVLIYDKDNKRIKAIKYSTGRYAS